MDQDERDSLYTSTSSRTQGTSISDNQNQPATDDTTPPVSEIGTNRSFCIPDVIGSSLTLQLSRCSDGTLDVQVWYGPETDLEELLRGLGSLKDLRGFVTDPDVERGSQWTSARHTALNHSTSPTFQDELYHRALWDMKTRSGDRKSSYPWARRSQHEPSGSTCQSGDARTPSNPASLNKTQSPRASRQDTLTGQSQHFGQSSRTSRATGLHRGAMNRRRRHPSLSSRRSTPRMARHPPKGLGAAGQALYPSWRVMTHSTPPLTSRGSVPSRKTRAARTQTRSRSPYRELFGDPSEARTKGTVTFAPDTMQTPECDSSRSRRPPRGSRNSQLLRQIKTQACLPDRPVQSEMTSRSPEESDDRLPRRSVAASRLARQAAWAALTNKTEVKLSTCHKPPHRWKGRRSAAPSRYEMWARDLSLYRSRFRGRPTRYVVPSR